jgi:hypothetical protein
MDEQSHSELVRCCAELMPFLASDATGEGPARLCRILKRVAAIPIAAAGKTEVDELAAAVRTKLVVSTPKATGGAAADEIGILESALTEGDGPGSVLELIETFDKANPEKGVAGCFRICMAAAAKSGKTWLVVQLIHVLKQLMLVHEVVVFSPTAKLSGDFEGVARPEHTLQFNETALWKIIHAAEKGKKLGRFSHVLIVFDDGLGDSSLEHSKAMEFLFTKGRHLNLSAIVISQAVNRLLTPTIKGSASHIIFGRLNPDAYKVLGKSMFMGMRLREFEDWVHVNVNAPYTFGVCQQGVGGLWRLRASAALPKVVLPPVEAVEAVAAKLAAAAPLADDDDDEL